MPADAPATTLEALLAAFHLRRDSGQPHAQAAAVARCFVARGLAAAADPPEAILADAEAPVAERRQLVAACHRDAAGPAASQNSAGPDDGAALAGQPASGSGPRLRADPELVAQWRRELPAGRLRVGIVWADDTAGGDRPTLDDLRPLLAVPGIAWVSLQSGAAAAEHAQLTGICRVLRPARAITGRDELAAAITALDLLVGVDSPAVRLAVGLGRPCWLLLPARGDEPGRGDPGRRCFRQASPGQWAGLAQAVRAELWTWAEARLPALAAGHYRQAAAWLGGRATPDPLLLPGWVEAVPDDELDWALNIAVIVSVRSRTRAAIDAIQPRLRTQAQREQALIGRLQAGAAAGECAGRWQELRRDGCRHADAWRHYACAIRSAEGLPAALALFAEAVALCPPNPALDLEYARTLLLAGERDAARNFAGQAAALAARPAAALVLLAQDCLDQARYAEACRFLDAALAREPHYRPAWQLFARLASRRDLPELAVAVLAALRAADDDKALRYELAENLARLGRDGEARALLAIDLAAPCDESDWPSLHALRVLDDWPEHDRRMAQIVAGGLLERRKHFDVGCRLLQRGDAAEGWRHYAQGLWSPRPPTRIAEWDGSDPAGKAILVFQDQGCGDLFQFLPLLRTLAARGARVSFAVETPLLALLAVQGLPVRLLAKERVDWQSGEFDWQVPQMLLPWRLGSDLVRPCHDWPILRAPAPAAVGAPRLPSGPRLKVGLRWAGNPDFAWEALRGSCLRDWRALAQVEGVDWYALQTGEAAGEAAELPEFGLAEPGHDPMHVCDSWEKTAAVVAQLDLVISVDTGLAHLSAALGVDTWILLAPFVTDFRWLQDRDDCPWYPSVRLFRRRRGESVAQCLAVVADALRRRLAEPPAAPPAADRIVAAATPPALAVDDWSVALAAWNDGQAETALAALQRLQARDPVHADARHLAGVILNDLGRHAEAAEQLRAACALQPENDQACSNLGFALHGSGDLAAAETVLRRGLALNPANPFAWFNLGSVLADAGRAAEAESAFGCALELDPDDQSAWLRLGQLRHARSDHRAAADAFQRAAGLDGPDTDAALRLAVFALADARLPAEAVAAGERLAERLGERGVPPDLQLLSQLLYCRLELCDWRDFDALLEACRQRLAAGETPLEPFSFLLLPGISGRQQRDLTAAFAAPLLQAGTLPPRAWHDAPRLRIGYLSADFHEHATAWLLAGVLEAHDRSAFDIHALSYGPADDSPMRRRIRAACAGFHEVAALDTAALARFISELGIDILVDLKGWTGDTRSAVLALRPAPVQVNWLGYPGTLGHRRLADYLIGDPVVTPPAHADRYAEMLALMPHCYQPNDDRRPIATAPSRAAAGLPEQAPVLCSFNRGIKIVPEVFTLWCEILRAVPEAVLWLLAGPPQATANLRREAAARGVDPARLVFAPLLPQAEHLARLSLADLVLDTWPCGAHTTASDALWAGVPVVTWPGDAFQSRVAASLLHAVGLPELVADGPDGYRQRILDLLAQPAALAGLRRRLAAQRRSSPLFDSAGFARALEGLYRAMWQRRGAGGHEPLLPLRQPASI